MTSLAVVVHAWSRLCGGPVLIALVLALRTAPALGWPRSVPGAMLSAWLALVLVPFPMQETLGDVDLFVVMVLVVFASRSMTQAVASRLIAGWLLVLLALAQAFGTLVVPRMTNLTLMSSAGVAYGIGLVGLAWVWWHWPQQTLPQRLSMASVACVWAGVACAPWHWSWQGVLVYALCLSACGIVWWVNPADPASAPHRAVPH